MAPPYKPTSAPPPTPTVKLPAGYKWVIVNGKFTAQPLHPAPPPAPTTQVQTGSEISGFGTMQPTYSSVGVGTRADDRAGAHGVGATATAPAKPGKGGMNVVGMQKYLVRQGYNIAVDGVNGPQTQAAAADYRGSRNPDAFNVGHGLIHHTTSPAATSTTTADSTVTTPVKPPPKRQVTVSPAGGGGAGGGAGGATGLAGLMYGQTDPTAQARSQVSALLDPVIQQIRDAENERAQQGTAAISGLTSALQSKYAPMASQIGGIYGDAESRQAAVDSAIQSALTGQGGAAASGLAARLASANLPNTDALVADTASRGTSAGTTALAKGSATLSGLIGQGASAGEYASKLPGIAGEQGLQFGRELQGQVSTDLKNQLSAIAARAPGLIQSVTTAITNARTSQQKNQIAAIIAEGYDPTTGQLTPKARASLAGALGFDPLTNKPTARTLIAANKAGAQGTPKVPTAKDIGKLVDAWKNGTIKNVTTIPTNPDGTPKYTKGSGAPDSVTQSTQTGQLNYGQAYKRLRAMGIGDAPARQYLNTAYQRGEQGRAWVTNAEQAVLQKAGLPPKAKVINGKGVLSAAQYQALRAAGVNPPGTLTAEGPFVIAQTY